MRSSGLLLSVLLLTPAPRADAGATLRWQELNREKGSPVQTTAVAYSGEPGLRIDISERTAAGPQQMTFLYLTSNHTLYMKQGTQAWVAVTPEVFKRAEETTASHPLAQVSVAPTHTRHTVAGFPCEGYQLRQRGLPSRLVCLANPADLRLDELTQEHFRQFTRILTVFMRASAAKRDPAQDQDEHIRFNTYDMHGGFPIREWESRKGDIWMDSQLTEILVGEPPAELFAQPRP